MKTEDQEEYGTCSRIKGKKHIVLLGASIGKAWEFSALPERINIDEYTFEFKLKGGFDKSDKLLEILSRDENKPNAVFLKECAAYFPEELQLYKELMKRWIGECLQHKVIPIPATVVPITRLHPLKKALIDLLKWRNPFKRDNPFNSKKNEAILEYNDWIKEFCTKNGLAVLDLEAEVRYSSTNRYLREDLARIDGLHLNNNAYIIFDKLVIPVLSSVDWEF